MRHLIAEVPILAIVSVGVRPQEGWPSGLRRTPGKRVHRKVSGVRIPVPPPTSLRFREALVDDVPPLLEAPLSAGVTPPRPHKRNREKPNWRISPSRPPVFLQRPNSRLRLKWGLSLEPEQSPLFVPKNGQFGAPQKTFRVEIYWLLTPQNSVGYIGCQERQS